MVTVWHADALATRLVAGPGRTITEVILESKTRPSLSARASFFSSFRINKCGSRH